MPSVTNKAARVFHFDAGMCGPGQTIELSPEELEKPFVQLILASGEVVEERDAQKLQAAEQRVQQAEKQAAQAQGAVQKTAEQVQKQHEQKASR